MTEPRRFKTREEYEAWKAAGGQPTSTESLAISVQTEATHKESVGHAIAGFRIAAALNLVGALSIFLQAKSAVHEIEALLCLLIAAVFSVGSTVAYNLQRLAR